MVQVLTSLKFGESRANAGFAGRDFFSARFGPFDVAGKNPAMAAFLQLGSRRFSSVTRCCVWRLLRACYAIGVKIRFAGGFFVFS
nr:hypothetical protein [Chromobacterium sp. ASV5]